MPVENCFGDIETGEDHDNNDEQQLIVVGEDLITPERMLRLRVKTISLVGSFISGCHQEIRVSYDDPNVGSKIKQDSTDDELATQRSKSSKEQKETDSDECGIILRLSRTNGTDTFQIFDNTIEGRGVDDSLDLPTLFEVKSVKFPRPLTFTDVKTVFDESRNLIRRYDQGNCHSLSQIICNTLVPGSYPSDDLDW